MAMLSGLVLQSDAAVDLQLHTVHSDGTWKPEQLIDYLVENQFGLAAITDHDRVDTVASLQKIASQKQMPLLVATEMTTTWRDEITDVLCFGFDLVKTGLSELAQDVQRRQGENSTEVFESLCRDGHLMVGEEEAVRSDILARILEKPNAQQPHELFALLVKHNEGTPVESLMQAMQDAGFFLATNPIGAVVEATHADGGVSLIAHPGRTDGFLTYDGALLDQLREDVPIDGLEVYYPKHTAAQVELYAGYAEAHGLLVSAGSDSHGPDKEPIKYPAFRCRSLLERLGIQLTLSS